MKAYQAGETVSFVAQRPCTLRGIRYRKGDEITIVLSRNWTEADGFGAGGPWGWGGYTAHTLRKLARRRNDQV